VKRQLESAGLAWETVEEKVRSGPPDAPKFEKLIFRAKGYSHLGKRGDLLLWFHTGRLMETIFYPEDVDGYLRALKAEGLAIPNMPADHVAVEIAAMPSTANASTGDHTRVRLGRDTEQRVYVAWTDRRLQREYLDWINAFA